MIENFNPDNLLSELNTSLGASYQSIPDALLVFFQTELSSSSSDLLQLELEWLQLQTGQTGSIPDLWEIYLTSIGETSGSVWDRAFNALAAGSIFWSPDKLFESDEAGAWYDVSDLSTLFEDAAGTSPANVDGIVGLIQDKSGNGNHASQSTAANKPILRKSGGLYYLEFDGVDDTLETASNFTVKEDFYVAGGFEINALDGSASVLPLFGVTSVGNWQHVAIRASGGSVRQFSCNLRISLGTLFQASYDGNTAFDQDVSFVGEGYHESNTLYASVDGDTPETISADDNTTNTNNLLRIVTPNVATKFYGGIYVNETIPTVDKARVRNYLAHISGVTL